MNKQTSLLKKHSLFGLILLGFSLFITQVTYAQANEEQETKPLKQYDVEIILFKNLKVPKGSEKTLPSQAPQLDEIFISLANQNDIDAAAELGFKIPEENEIRLLDIVNKIKASSRYKLLTHIAWRQPGLHKNNAIAVQIRTGDIFGNDFSSIDNPVTPLLIDEEIDINTLPKINLTRSGEAPEKPKLVWYELEGKITITLARYLHAHVDLVLRIPNKNTIEFNDTIETGTAIDSPEEFSFFSATLNNYALKERRRMRSRKLHYLDHPELGMLILITPYEEATDIEFIEEDLNLGSLSFKNKQSS